MRLRLLTAGVAVVVAADAVRVASAGEDLPTPRESYDAAVEAGTARFTNTMELVAKGAQYAAYRTVANGGADFAHATTSSRVDVDPNTELLVHPFHDIVTTADRLYLKAVGGWVSCPMPADIAGRGPGVQPTVPLEYVREAGSWRRVGSVMLADRPVHHFRARVDRLKADVDAWVGLDDRPVRVTVSLAVEPWPMTMRLDLRDYGARVAVTVPDDARPTRDVGAAYEAAGL